MDATLSQEFFRFLETLILLPTANVKTKNPVFMIFGTQNLNQFFFESLDYATCCDFKRV